MVKKANREYWKKRFEALEDKQYQESEAYYRDVEEQFRKVCNGLTLDIERWYQRLADNNDISLAAAKRLLKKSELDEFLWSVEEYIQKGEENSVDQRWMKELENASARHHISYLEAMKLQVRQYGELLAATMENGLTEYLHKTYSEQYYRAAVEITNGTKVGMNLTRLDEKKIDAAIRYPWASDGKSFSDRIWSNKERLVQKLHTELVQNLIRGESPRTAIDQIAAEMNTSKKNAGRLIMTESAAISSRAHSQCFKELGVKQYEIVATLDSHTSEICREMDGRVFDLKDYEMGVTAPPFHPWCRTTTVPHFDDEFTVGEQRAARDEETGKTVYVPAGMKYEEWRKEYTDGSDIVNDLDYNIIKNIRIPSRAYTARNITPDVIDEIQSGIDEIMREYDAKIDRILVEDISDRLPDTPYLVRFTDESGMKKVNFVINLGFDFNGFQEVVSAGYECGYFAGKTIKDHAIHEMAHVMTGQQYKTMSAFNDFEERTREKYVFGVSGYSDYVKDGFETIAEAFVRIRNNESVPEDAEKLVQKYIERWRKQ